MAGLLLTRVISTAQTLALDLGDQALLNRLTDLEHRAHLERVEDVHQLLNELMSINEALGRPSAPAGAMSPVWASPAC